MSLFLLIRIRVGIFGFICSSPICHIGVTIITSLSIEKPIFEKVDVNEITNAFSSELSHILTLVLPKALMILFI